MGLCQNVIGKTRPYTSAPLQLCTLKRAGLVRLVVGVKMLSVKPAPTRPSV
ncbi:hypothetical protein [Coleofasciculus sp. E2-BRE-01]|uniref:hypothetical protein n=1 Tax=Coleofasciculus sp. E2-BRE-01 TaxID=3069524 RepID=UPI004063440E